MTATVQTLLLMMAGAAAVDPARRRRTTAGADPGTSAGHARAGSGAARDPAAADLFGGRRDELARIPLQFAADRTARRRLRAVHDWRCGGRRALSAWPSMDSRLRARRHHRAARYGRAARDRSTARAAAAACRRARKARARQTR